MPNYLNTIKNNFNQAKKSLEKALGCLTSADTTNVEINQWMNVTDAMAEVLKDKPVIIVQSLDVRMVIVNNFIQDALRRLERINDAHLRLYGTKQQDIEDEMRFVEGLVCSPGTFEHETGKGDGKHG